MYYGDKWNPENDWSYQQLEIFKDDTAFFSTGNEVRNDNICVYSDGVLVGGIEPDGSKPVTEEPTTENDEIVYGDSNCDGDVNVADAVFIMQVLSNPSEYKLSEQGLKNADVVENNGITTQDALAIQMLGINMLQLSDFPLDKLVI